MYGSGFDFSDVILPGAGGQINASNAMSDTTLKKLNKSKAKWRPDAHGMAYHSEALKKNQMAREHRENLINREYNEVADGQVAMGEIFDRKRSRMASFKEMKKAEYGFGEQDAELLSIPQPFKEKKTHKCTGPGCPICTSAKYAEIEYREWSGKKRKALQEGKVKGEFAGPDMSFPIAGPVDVSAAWASVGRAANPRAIMKKIIEIAKKHGWESGLPESVKKRMASGESGLPSGEKK